MAAQKPWSSAERLHGMACRTYRRRRGANRVLAALNPGGMRSYAAVAGVIFWSAAAVFQSVFLLAAPDLSFRLPGPLSLVSDAWFVK